MENKKLENQKIEEKDLANVAGGYDMKINYCDPNNTEPPKTKGTFFVDDDELKILKESNILNDDGHINEENLGVAQFALGFMPDSETGKKRGKNEITID